MPTNNILKMVVIGINHKNAPLEVREKYSFSDQSLKQHYQSLLSKPQIEETFILSTCNRVEVYVVGRDVDSLALVLKNYLGEVHHISQDFLEKYFYQKNEEVALAHLLRVSSGLDSMVIGEPQIMGQVRKAYDQACCANAIGTTLHSALQNSLRVGKKVRLLTGISRGVTSISGVVIELLKKEDNLKNKKVLVIGAGKIGAMTVVKLASLPLAEITVTNRDITRAAELEKIKNVRIADLANLEEELVTTDVVIAATAAPGYLVDRRTIERVLQRKEKKLFLIDLGVPRNIEESMRTLSGVQLYNIDNLAPIITETIHSRLQEAKKAEEIIKRELVILERENDRRPILTTCLPQGDARDLDFCEAADNDVDLDELNIAPKAQLCAELFSV